MRGYRFGRCWRFSSLSAAPRARRHRLPPAPLAPRPTVTAPEGPSCNVLEKPLSAGGASIVPEIAGQQKNWQPPGGEIAFTVRSFVQIPAGRLRDRVLPLEAPERRAGQLHHGAPDPSRPDRRRPPPEDHRGGPARPAQSARALLRRRRIFRAVSRAARRRAHPGGRARTRTAISRSSPTCRTRSASPIRSGRRCSALAHGPGWRSGCSAWSATAGSSASAMTTSIRSSASSRRRTAMRACRSCRWCCGPSWSRHPPSTSWCCRAS